MRKILVTGGTVFVSRSVAEYFVGRGDEVYVLNRNNSLQSEKVILIEGDRHNLGDKLKNYNFDVVLDITAYTEKDVKCLIDALGEINDYIMISSSAVYPETNQQPFTEEQDCGPNVIWGAYGTNKLAAEQYLRRNVPQAYILRPPYLYGPKNNLYREGLVFDCAQMDRPFYVPGNGKMKLQFFYIEDLCKLIEIILDKKPEEKVLNVGNNEAISINEWVKLCYAVLGKEPKIINVDKEHHSRAYFSFYDYEYVLDVTRQNQLLKETKPMLEGLKESYEWYKNNKHLVARRDYISYIDTVINK